MKWETNIQPAAAIRNLGSTNSVTVNKYSVRTLDVPRIVLSIGKQQCSKQTGVLLCRGQSNGSNDHTATHLITDQHMYYKGKEQGVLICPEDLT